MKNSLIYILSLLMLAGCNSTSGGTSTGNPLVTFKMTASSQAATVASYRPSFMSPWWSEILKPAMALPPPALLDSTGLSVTLSDAWVVVGKLEFKATETAEAGEVAGSEVSFEGPFVVNLLSNNPDSFGQARVVSPLKRIRMELENNASSLPSNAPVELSGKSIFWKGTVNGHIFTFACTQGYQYELSGPNGVALTDNSTLLMSIRIADLFKKINLAGITATTSIDENNKVTATNPCPTIDASAADLYTCFSKGLNAEANLGKDDNGDGELNGD
ncbi:MAG: hypothetical protein ACXVCP_15960, partial [Bdellovibrio sp.]